MAPDSPLSPYDLRIIMQALAAADVTEYQRQEERQDNEVVISAKRVSLSWRSKENLRVLGVPLRLSDKIGLNDGLLIRQGREPIAFVFAA